MDDDMEEENYDEEDDDKVRIINITRHLQK